MTVPLVSETQRFYQENPWFYGDLEVRSQISVLSAVEPPLSDEFAAMQTGFAFYAGNQWSGKDLAKLQREGRPALTINLILPIIYAKRAVVRQRMGGSGFEQNRNGGKPLKRNRVASASRFCCRAVVILEDNGLFNGDAIGYD